MVPRIASVGGLTASAAALALDVGTPVWIPDTRGAAPGKKPGCAGYALSGADEQSPPVPAPAVCTELLASGRCLA